MARVRSRHLVSVAALALLALPAATLPARGASPSEVVKVTVPGNVMWTVTPVTLAAGESASITATGTISRGIGWPPEGPAQALNARVGDGQPFLVGSPGTVRGPGTLALGFNDDETLFGDNTGSFAVTITRGAKPPAPELPPASDAIARPSDAKSVRTGKTNYGGVTITRGGQRYRATAQSMLRPGDVISTDGKTVMTLEFAIGGRTGLGPSSSIRIVGDRQVEALRGTTTATVPDYVDDPVSGAHRHRIEIQTNGGTMGIRG